MEQEQDMLELEEQEQRQSVATDITKRELPLSSREQDTGNEEFSNQDREPIASHLHDNNDVAILLGNDDDENVEQV